MNQIMIKGNVGQNPELRDIGNGQSVCRFSVAVNESYFTKTNEKKETTTWFNVSVWGKRAESLVQRLSKGSRVFVIGKVRQSKYTDKQGVEKTNFEIIANSVEIIEVKGSQEESSDESAEA